MCQLQAHSGVQNSPLTSAALLRQRLATIRHPNKCNNVHAETSPFLALLQLEGGHIDPEFSTFYTQTRHDNLPARVVLVRSPRLL